MQEIVAYCGLVCNECPTYQATQKNDDNARAKVAGEWSKQYKHDFKPEDINCDGCLAVGKRQLGFCQVCDIKKCGSDKKIPNCGYCADYPCSKIDEFHARAPHNDAKAKLEAIRNKNHIAGNLK
jgi:hypothetical protein